MGILNAVTGLIKIISVEEERSHEEEESTEQSEEELCGKRAVDKGVVTLLKRPSQQCLHE